MVPGPLSGEILGPLVAPFDAPGTGVSVSIEAADGTVLAGAGDEAVAAGSGAQVSRAIRIGDEEIGRVVGRGQAVMIQAIVESIAAAVEALLGAAETRHDPGRARMEAELALARRIQRSFVPLIPPDIPGYEIASHYEAATEVGGDFFDVFRVRTRPGKLAIVIADVTGKGIAAALLMAFARPLLHAAIDHTAVPGEALTRTNRILVQERRSSLFITALCAIVDLRSGALRLANAGHDPPLVVPSGDAPIRWLEGSGPLLGAFDPLDLGECRLDLGPGDLVLFYTDGVTDARAESGERFGDERLIATLERLRDGPPDEVVGGLVAAIRAFQGSMPAADDVTIVAIRRADRAGRQPAEPRRAAHPG